MNTPRIQCHHEEIIAATAAAVFPQLCPRAEYNWIRGWHCEILHSASGGIEDHCIFREGLTAAILFPSEAASTIWLVSHYDRKSSRVQFILWFGEVASGRIDLHAENVSDGSSRVSWSFVLSSLKGGFRPDLPDRAGALLAHLGACLKHYCETGEMLNPGAQGVAAPGNPRESCPSIS